MKKYYVVFMGRVLGVYEKWEDAKAQLDRYSGCKHQSYCNVSEKSVQKPEYHLRQKSLRTESLKELDEKLIKY